MLFESVQEIPAAISAFDLPITKQVDLGQQFVGQKTDTFSSIPAVPVVTVGKMEQVNVPFGREKLFVDEPVGKLIGGGNFGAAAFANGEKRFAIHFLGNRIVHDVTQLDAIVLGSQPGIDPERFEPHN